MKQHLKRLAAPRTWPVARKTSKFIARPLPGAHRLGMCMPLGVILRDVLGRASSAREARLIVRNRNVLVDNRPVTESRFQVGLMDTLSLPETGEYYRMAVNSRGQLALVPIPAEEASLKVCSVVRKTVVGGGSIQASLHDGRVVSSGSAYSIGDGLLIRLPGQEIVSHLKLEKGAIVYMAGGRHIGRMGVVEDFSGTKLVINVGGESVQTLKRFAIVVGRDHPIVRVVQ
ncbi:30S ribosomal protein S4e [Candidatus Woesearchaeota archaeon]|nr:30S ribosomal protein S4e [Candidatus Woesearchaeota archaeon]